jgi:nucleoside-triphosphatase
MKHLLIVGRPGIGKTTLLQRLAASLRSHPARRSRPIDGFLTEELREEGQRMGFWLSPLDGRQILLAHRHWDHGERVGMYKVNVSVLETVAVSVIRRSLSQASLLFLDELGKMELCSRSFEQAVQEAFDHGPSIVATAGLTPLPFLDALKRRKDVELIPLSSANRSSVEEELTARLSTACAEDDSIQRLERHADRICEMIISSEAAPLDIEIQQTRLHEAVAQRFPDQPARYALVYDSRFRRLWQQFRHR